MRSCIYCGKTLEKTEKCTCPQSIMARESKKKVNFNSEKNENPWHGSDNVYTTGYTKKEQKRRKIFDGEFSLKGFFKDPIKGIAVAKATGPLQFIIVFLTECLIFGLVNFLNFKSIFIALSAVMGFLILFLVFWGVDRLVFGRKTSFFAFSTRLLYAFVLPLLVMVASGIPGMFSVRISAVGVLTGMMILAVLFYEALRSQWNFLKPATVFYVVAAGFMVALVVFFYIL